MRSTPGGGAAPRVRSEGAGPVRGFRLGLGFGSGMDRGWIERGRDRLPRVVAPCERLHARQVDELQPAADGAAAVRLARARLDLESEELVRA